MDAAPLDDFPLEVLLGEGLMLEEEYYQALAHDLGCEYYVGSPPPFARDFDAMNGLRSGVAPLEARRDRPRAVIAPRGVSLARLIQFTRSGRLHPESFAVTSPHRFASLVRIQHADAVLRGALGRLPAAESARSGLGVCGAALNGSWARCGALTIHSLWAGAAAR